MQKPHKARTPDACRTRNDAKPAAQSGHLQDQDRGRAEAKYVLAHTTLEMAFLHWEQNQAILRDIVRKSPMGDDAEARATDLADRTQGFVLEMAEFFDRPENWSRLNPDGPQPRRLSLSERQALRDFREKRAREEMPAKAPAAPAEPADANNVAKLTARLDTVLRVSGMEGKPTRGQMIVEEVRKRMKPGDAPIDVCRQIAREDFETARKTGAGRWLRKAKALAVNRAYVRGEEPSNADVETLAKTLKRERNRALAIAAPEAKRARPRK